MSQVNWPYLPPSPFLLLNTKPQYREWTVGLLSSVACPPCSCSLLPAKSLFSILIGQKMQMTGLDNANNMRNATCANTQTSIEWPYCTFLKLWQNCHSENGIHDWLRDSLHESGLSYNIQSELIPFLLWLYRFEVYLFIWIWIELRLFHVNKHNLISYGFNRNGMSSIRINCNAIRIPVNYSLCVNCCCVCGASCWR